MKSKLLYLLLFFALPGFAQDLDEGFGNFKINGSATAVGTLEEVAPEALWMPEMPEMAEYYTHLGTADVSALGATQFFGLSIARIEVKIGWGFDMETEEEVEVVRGFTLYLEDVDAAAFGKFMTAIMDVYGPIMTYSIDEDENESPTWFGMDTLMTVSGDGVRVTHNGKKYIAVVFDSASGG